MIICGVWIMSFGTGALARNGLGTLAKYGLRALPMHEN